MTPAEHHLLMMVQIFILGSIPLALLAFQVWFRKPAPSPAPQPVIPHEDESPAGSFLDVALPPPALPLPEEKGVPVRQWKRVDGWMALLLVAVLGVLMGPLLSTPGKTESAPFSTEQWTVQLAFQIGFAGLVLFYLSQIRHLDLVKLFGLRRLRPVEHLSRALAWIIPGMVGIFLIAVMVTPPLLRLLDLPKASPQGIVSAIQDIQDPWTKVLIAISACIGAPLMEEIIFRGFLYGVAKRFTHSSYAAVCSALMFAVIHANVGSFLPLMLLGLLFVAAYEYTGSLVVPVIMHALFNLLQLSYLFFGPELIPHAG
ncbi:MAG: type II CAAX endopeptidase family protein [Verrucomicrobiota bacterium]